MSWLYIAVGCGHAQGEISAFSSQTCWLAPKKPVHVGCVTVCSSWSQMLYSSGDKPGKQFLFALLKFFRILEPVMEGVEGKLKIFAHEEISRKLFCQGNFFLYNSFLSSTLRTMEIYRTFIILAYYTARIKVKVCHLILWKSRSICKY